MKKEYYKLVRDRIPELIVKDGDYPKFVILEDKDYRNELKLKLREECDELINSLTIEEFADVLEVLEALAKERKISWDNILKAKEEKVQRNGSFDKKVFLMYSEG